MAVQFIQQALLQSPNGKQKKALIDLLVKQMGRYYPDRSHQNVHASDLTSGKFCARQYRLMDVLGVTKPDRYIPAPLKATFDVGKATADLVVNEWGGEQVIGHWECTTCEKTAKWTTKPKPGCLGMGNCNWRYKEVVFKHAPTGVTGSIDMFVQLGGTKVTAVEIKIMKVDDFEKLAAPLGEHRIRTRMYLKIIAESSSPYRTFVDTDSAKVLYISRGFGKKSEQAYGQIVPFKEFDVHRDDDSVTLLLMEGGMVAKSRAENTVPAHRPCTSIGCSQAKVCPVKNACWSGEY